MPPNNACAPDGKPAAAAQCPLPNESHERWRERKIPPAGTAPGSLGNKSADGLACDASPKHKLRWNDRMALSRLGLLLILPVAVILTERLAGRVSQGIQNGSTGIGWYVRSGQWRADVRTAAAVCEFVMHADADMTRQDRPPANPLAATEPQSPPGTPNVAEAGKPSHSGS